MRVFSLLVLLFLLSAFVFSQNVFQEKFKEKGKFDFDVPSEQILTCKFTDGGRKLTLVGRRYIQIWDVENFKILDAREHKIEYYDGAGTWAISPDAKKLFVAGNPLAADEEGKQAAIWSIETGERIKVLKKTAKPILAGIWSKNGATLVTLDDKNSLRHFIYPSFFLVNEVGEYEFGLWDGETLEFRNALTLENLVWSYLSPDGARLLTVSGPKKDFFGIDYASEKADAIDVWDARTGKLEKQLETGGEDFFARTRKAAVSPDGRYLALILKSRKRASDDKMVVWEIGGATVPKYAVKADPKIADSDLRYSPDSLLVALDSGKNTQFYDLSSGARVLTMNNIDPPDYWMSGNKTVIDYDLDKLRAFDTTSGKMLYEMKLLTVVEDRPTGNYSTDENGYTTEQTESVITDFTRIIPRPGDGIFMTYSNQYVRIFDSKTGGHLQTLVNPPIIFTKAQKKKFSGEKLVSDALWSADGKRIFIMNADKTAISVWEEMD